MNTVNMRAGSADLQGLEELCRELIGKNDRVVEIGCYAGESSQVIARYAGRLYCIDRWKDGLMETSSQSGVAFHYRSMASVQARFDAAVATLSNIVKIQGHSSDLAEVFRDGAIDLVYIDALHSFEAVQNDIRRWWGKIRDDGHIGGHNWSPHWPGVVRAVRESFGKPDKVYRDTSWIVRKTKLRRQRFECVTP